MGSGMALRYFALAGLALLAACGPLQQSNPLIGAVGALFGGRQAVEPGTDTPITRATFDASPVPLILSAPVSEEAVYPMVLTGLNGTTETFRDDAGRSLSLRDGIIVASRGYGDDLMGTDAPGLKQALIAGTGTIARRMSWLGRRDEIRTEVFICQVTLLETKVIELYEQQFAIRQLGEVCQGETGGFANNYWVTRDGTIVQLRQWLSIGTGHMDIQRP